MSSPFQRLEITNLLGHSYEGFECIHCGGAAQTWLAAAFKAKTDKPSYVLAYAMCGRCASLYWEESGQDFFDELNDVLKQVAE